MTNEELKVHYLALANFKDPDYAQHLKTIDEIVLPVIRKFRTIERDDAIQIVRMALIRSLPKFDAKRGSVFQWLLLTAKGCLALELASRNRAKRRASYHSTSIFNEVPKGDCTIAEIIPDTRPSELSVEDQEQCDQLKDKLKYLTPLEYGSIWGIVNGASYRTIAKHLGVKEKDIDNAYARARKSLKKRKSTNKSWNVHFRKHNNSFAAYWKGNYLGQYDTELQAVGACVKRQSMPARRQRGTSKHPGVCFVKARNNWKAQRKLNGRTICYGSFKTEQEAIMAYLRATTLYDAPKQSWFKPRSILEMPELINRSTFQEVFSIFRGSEINANFN